MDEELRRFTFQPSSISLLLIFPWWAASKNYGIIFNVNKDVYLGLMMGWKTKDTIYCEKHHIWIKRKKLHLQNDFPHVMVTTIHTTNLSASAHKQTYKGFPPVSALSLTLLLRVSTAGNFLRINLTADSRFLSIRYEGLALGSPHAWKKKKHRRRQKYSKPYCFKWTFCKTMWQWGAVIRYTTGTTVRHEWEDEETEVQGFGNSEKMQCRRERKSERERKRGKWNSRIWQQRRTGRPRPISVREKD